MANRINLDNSEIIQSIQKTEKMYEKSFYGVVHVGILIEMQKILHIINKLREGRSISLSELDCKPIFCRCQNAKDDKWAHQFELAV